MSDLITVLYRIARTGQPVPTDAPAPPDYVPWPHAPITWTRIEGDYGPGIVRPRDSITTRADEHGEGAVYLAPGRYRITLPSRDTRDVTVSPGLGTIDLSALLAGGGVEPDDPQYPTLAAYVVDQIGVALEDQLDAIDEAVETAGESATTAQEARDAAIAAAQAAEAAADLAEERADRTPTATLEELDTIEPLPGRIRYVPEIGRPAWADGEEWRVAQGWLVDFSRLRIIDTLYDDGEARVYLNIAPRIPEGARS